MFCSWMRVVRSIIAGSNVCISHCDQAAISTRTLILQYVFNCGLVYRSWREIAVATFTMPYELRGALCDRFIRLVNQHMRCWLRRCVFDLGAPKFQFLKFRSQDKNKPFCGPKRPDWLRSVEGQKHLRCWKLRSFPGTMQIGFRKFFTSLFWPITASTDADMVDLEEIEFASKNPEASSHTS